MQIILFTLFTLLEVQYLTQNVQVTSLQKLTVSDNISHFDVEIAIVNSGMQKKVTAVTGHVNIVPAYKQRKPA